IGTIAGGQPVTVTADDKFVDELIADLGFQPRGLIDRVLISPMFHMKHRRSGGCLTVSKHMLIVSLPMANYAREWPPKLIKKRVRGFNCARGKDCNASTNQRLIPSCCAFLRAKCAG